MINTADLMNGNEERDFGAGDFFCAEALVARNDDPENRCRVQLTIPIFDENEIHEIWARRVNLFVGENGFGDYFIPEIGAEVVVLGRMGDTNNLFYATLWNEERKPSGEFPDKSVAGVQVPNDLKLIAGKKVWVKAENIEAIAQQVAKILAQNIESNARQLNKILGSQVRIEGNQIQHQGTTITLNANGSVSIQGGNVSISGTSVTIEGRSVKKVGPPI